MAKRSKRTKATGMSKSILIIDTPEKCDGCIMHSTMIGKQICNAEIKRIKDESKKPDWCPLKKIPDKQVIHCTDTAHHRWAKTGYNVCIGEILKERGKMSNEMISSVVELPTIHDAGKVVEQPEDSRNGCLINRNETIQAVEDVLDDENIGYQPCGLGWRIIERIKNMHTA